MSLVITLLVVGFLIFIGIQHLRSSSAKRKKDASEKSDDK